MTERIGIFGGMFDPVHRAHIAVAETARLELGLDELHIVPCHLPNHKESTYCAPEHRLKMLQLATQAYPEFTINTIELAKRQTSYSVETVEEFSCNYPTAELVFILGADAFQKLESWHRWQDMLSLCQFYVFSRPGSSLPSRLGSVEVRKITDFSSYQGSEHGAGLCWASETLAIDVSSTALRTQLRRLSNEGQCVARQHSHEPCLTEWIDRKVLNYITENRLYVEA